MSLSCWLGIWLAIVKTTYTLEAFLNAGKLKVSFLLFEGLWSKNSSVFLFFCPFINLRIDSRTHVFLNALQVVTVKEPATCVCGSVRFAFTYALNEF